MSQICRALASLLWVWRSLRTKCAIIFAIVSETRVIPNAWRVARYEHARVAVSDRTANIDIRHRHTRPVAMLFHIYHSETLPGCPPHLPIVAGTFGRVIRSNEVKRMLELNHIYNEDCLGERGMCLIPDKSIDLILADLPYGVTQNHWDCILPLDELWSEYERIIKDNGAIVLTATTPFDKILGASNIKLLRYEWVWEKDRVTGHLNANRMPMRSHENILVFYKKLPVYHPQKTVSDTKSHNSSFKKESPNYGKFKSMPFEGSYERYPRSVIHFNAVNSAHGFLHPTQKPVELFEYLIRTYTDEGQTVLDNCIGSGTTGVAALQSNRNFIGFELDAEYHRIATERIANVQSALFV